MADYFVIDADSHVEEPIEAWEHLDVRYRERRPFPIAVPIGLSRSERDNKTEAARRKRS